MGESIVKNDHYYSFSTISPAETLDITKNSNERNQLAGWSKSWTKAWMKANYWLPKCESHIFQLS